MKTEKLIEIINEINSIEQSANYSEVEKLFHYCSLKNEVSKNDIKITELHI